MIKTTLLCRASDGLVLCQASDFSATSKDLQETKLALKKHQKDLRKDESNVLRQVESSQFGIFLKQNDGVIYTVIADLQYPAKLASLYLDCIIGAFADELKTLYGASTNVRSKLETIENSHHFVKFDRVIKQKKADYEDIQSGKNLARLKSDLESIREIVKVNMDLVNNRTRALEETEERAKKLNEQAKKFKTTTQKLKWQLWLKSNLFWVVLAILLLVVGYLVFL